METGMLSSKFEMINAKFAICNEVSYYPIFMLVLMDRLNGYL